MLGACSMAKDALLTSQRKMKNHRKSVPRGFQLGDRVLALLRISGAALQSKFAGPYETVRKLSETDCHTHS